MEPSLALLPSWLDPNAILEWLGPWALVGTLVIVFAECGLLVGFFLPGDSLLFTAGLFVAAGDLDVELWLLCLLISVVAVAGNLVGYWIGRKAGPSIFERPESRIFKQEYVDKTMEFFEQYGARAIVMARFVPIVRTFITVTAGVGRMDRRKYLTYSGIGAVLWASGVTILGRLLGKVQFIHDHIESALLLIVLISVVPVAIEALRHRRAARRNAVVVDPPAVIEQEAWAAVHESDYKDD